MYDNRFKPCCAKVSSSRGLQDEDGISLKQALAEAFAEAALEGRHDFRAILRAGEKQRAFKCTVSSISMDETGKRGFAMVFPDITRADLRERLLEHPLCHAP